MEHQCHCKKNCKTQSLAVMRVLLLVIISIYLIACEPLLPQKVIDGKAELIDSSVDWSEHGRTNSEQRFSPLKNINRDTVAKLGLHWSYEFDTARGQEATPLAVNGVIYTTTAWSKVFAFDGVTGELLWSYDPKVPGEAASKGCCDVVNRGAAYSDGRVFVGTFDGRLIALDANTGELLWSTLTVDPSKPYTISGAPRTAKGKVFIGNGGADLGVRGYVGAYDTESGQLIWRFYTVPGDPENGADGAASDDILDHLASDTWTGREYLKYGGGGTVWDSIVYDMELDQLYIGVGNGSPINHLYRSEGKGDNLFLSSIVALNPDTGAYIWHYQEVPGETWDYTASQQMTLTDLDLQGSLRKVILHAPKNGFFYIIDRLTGKLISAEKFAPVNWASHIDLQSGRPVETKGARYTEDPFIAISGGAGVHDWQPMSFNPETGLVYLPIQVLPFMYVKEDPNNRRDQLNLGYELFDEPMPTDSEGIAAVDSILTGSLLAWDPVVQKPIWKVDHPKTYNGGTMVTGGNLVFQGTAEGNFNAYDALSGDELWSVKTGIPILAAPVTYSIAGHQYVAIMAGNGGAVPLSIPAFDGPKKYPNGHLFVFKLNGSAKLPVFDMTPMPLQSPEIVWSKEDVTIGKSLFAYNCASCHGSSTLSTGVLPDLKRAFAVSSKELWNAIVVGGSYKKTGMPNFGTILTAKEAELIRSYVGSESLRIQASSLSEVAQGK